MINEYSFSTNCSTLGLTENRHRFIQVNDYLDFDEFLAEIEILWNQSEFDARYQLCSTNSFNNSSFEPQHYLEDSYIPIFAFIYTLAL